MSNAALYWAARVKVGHQPSKHVLEVLADYADEDVSCWPSQEYLAERCEMSVRSIRNCLTLLEERGLIERRQDKPKPGLRVRLTRYYLVAYRPPGESDSPPRAVDKDAAPAAGSSKKDAAAHAEDAESHDKRMRNLTTTESIRESTSESSERVGDRRLIEIRELYPRSDQVDQYELDDAWAALTEDERGEAHRHFARWLERAGKGRRYPVGLVKYLAQKLWLLMPPEEAPAGAPADFVALELFSRPWWFALWWRAMSSDRIKASVMAANAQQRIGSSAKGELKAALDAGRDAELARLSVEADADAIAAWNKWLFDRHRVWLPVPHVAPYLWAPAALPSDNQTIEAVLNGEQSSEATQAR